MAIDASHGSFQFYSHGVYKEQCSPENLDHGVLAIGYGVEEGTGEAYWLIKNSWGTSWGHNGYVKMARNEDNMCGVASAAIYPLVLDCHIRASLSTRCLNVLLKYIFNSLSSGLLFIKFQYFRGFHGVSR